MRSKTAASSALFVFCPEEEGDCAKAVEIIALTSKPTREQTRRRKRLTTRETRQDILQFFYAVLSVKSNEAK